MTYVTNGSVVHCCFFYLNLPLYKIRCKNKKKVLMIAEIYSGTVKVIFYGLVSHVYKIFLRFSLFALYFALVCTIGFSVICIKSLYEPSPIYSDEDFNTDFISLDLCKDCTSGDKNTDIVMNFFFRKRRSAARSQA